MLAKSFCCAIGCNEIEGFIYLCDGAYLQVVFSFNMVPIWRLTTLRGLAGTEVESILYTDSLSAWYVTLTSSALDFLFSLFYRTENCAKFMLVK